MATQKITSDPSTPSAPEYVFQGALAREVGLSRLLVAYISTVIAFMLLPGAFLGVWNLISISNQSSTIISGDLDRDTLGLIKGVRKMFDHFPQRVHSR